MKQLSVSKNIAEIIFAFLVVLFLTLNAPTLGAETIPAAVKPAESVWNLPFSAQAGPDLPVRLKIPKIRVDAAFEYVGLTRNGAVEVPKSLSKVAWFDLGPLPGEVGSAIITGHYGWKDKKRSAFDNLYKLRKGDKLYVQNYEGKVITFVVRKIRRYGPKANATEVFVSNDSKAHLNLITCEGAWNKVTKSYPIRLVIFTDKE